MGPVSSLSRRSLARRRDRATLCLPRRSSTRRRAAGRSPRPREDARLPQTPRGLRTSTDAADGADFQSIICVICAICGYTSRCGQSTACRAEASREGGSAPLRACRAVASRVGGRPRVSPTSRGRSAPTNATGTKAIHRCRGWRRFPINHLWHLRNLWIHFTMWPVSSLSRRSLARRRERATPGHGDRGHPQMTRMAQISNQSSVSSAQSVDTLHHESSAIILRRANSFSLGSAVGNEPGWTSPADS